jgi:hypothetical protein
MARQWVVLFDTLGVDTLLPWDDLRADDMLAKLAGKKTTNKWGQRVNMMIIRAQANMQRWPEVWAYDTSEDWNHEDMLEQWKRDPQITADTVRACGTNLFRHQRPKEIIV